MIRFYNIVFIVVYLFIKYFIEYRFWVRFYFEYGNVIVSKVSRGYCFDGFCMSYFDFIVKVSI